MNGSPSTNKGVILIVVCALVFNATLIVLSVCYCLVVGKEVNQTLLNSALSIGNFLLGAIAGMLTKTSPTEATKQPTVIIPPTEPTPVQVVNEPSDPVPTTDEPPK